MHKIEICLQIWSLNIKRCLTGFILLEITTYFLFRFKSLRVICALGRNPSPTESFWRGTTIFSFAPERFLIIVLSAGIEPASLPSEGSVLSIVAVLSLAMGVSCYYYVLQKPLPGRIIHPRSSHLLSYIRSRRIFHRNSAVHP